MKSARVWLLVSTCIAAVAVMGGFGCEHAALPTSPITPSPTPTPTSTGTPVQPDGHAVGTTSARAAQTNDLGYQECAYVYVTNQVALPDANGNPVAVSIQGTTDLSPVGWGQFNVGASLGNFAMDYGQTQKLSAVGGYDSGYPSRTFGLLLKVSVKTPSYNLGTVQMTYNGSTGLSCNMLYTVVLTYHPTSTASVNPISAEVREYPFTSPNGPATLAE